MQIEQVILLAIQFVFALIFFFIYLFYPRAKEHLIFTFLTVLAAPIIYLNFAEDTVVNVVILRLVTLTSLCLALYFLYTLFYKNPIKFLYCYIAGCSITASRDQISKAHQELQKAHEELRQAQNRLVQSEKMASLGNLVAGVAHEINTPIGAVNSAADTSKRAIGRVIQSVEESQSFEDLNANQKFRDALNFIKGNNDVITMASERIVKIVKSLRSFARLDEADYEDADMHEGIDSTLTLLHHMTKDRIEIVKEYGDIPRMCCHLGQLNQVFMNILKNDAESIEGKGTIHIKTSVEDKKVIIRISDNGQGIREESLSKIFDPGFTTKGVGVGTGLGLSISYNIIQDHSGKIEVESEEGKGSTFSIILPIKRK
jgi:signal transduction histidine kinase